MKTVLSLFTDTPVGEPPTPTEDPLGLESYKMSYSYDSFSTSISFNTSAEDTVDTLYALFSKAANCTTFPSLSLTTYASPDATSHAHTRPS
jgi:hypothetical protein